MKNGEIVCHIKGKVTQVQETEPHSEQHRLNVRAHSRRWENIKE